MHLIPNNYLKGKKAQDTLSKQWEEKVLHCKYPKRTKEADVDQNKTNLVPMSAKHGTKVLPQDHTMLELWKTVLIRYTGPWFGPCPSGVYSRLSNKNLHNNIMITVTYQAFCVLHSPYSHNYTCYHSGEGSQSPVVCDQKFDTLT